MLRVELGKGDFPVIFLNRARKNMKTIDDFVIQFDLFDFPILSVIRTNCKVELNPNSFEQRIIFPSERA